VIQNTASRRRMTAPRRTMASDGVIKVLGSGLPTDAREPRRSRLYHRV
jgi:hypothetical protein